MKNKFICTCNECFYTWESDEEYTVFTFCPKCHQGDIHYELNTEYTPQTEFNGANLNENDKIV